MVKWVKVDTKNVLALGRFPVDVIIGVGARICNSAAPQVISLIRDFRTNYHSHCVCVWQATSGWSK